MNTSDQISRAMSAGTCPHCQAEMDELETLFPAQARPTQGPRQVLISRKLVRN
jgi:hypothetical protein